MGNNPQKILTGRYQVVPRSIILLISGNQVLLQKGSPDKKIYPGYYNGIGGHIERGEDVFSGARRELIEEAGITCEDLSLAGTIMIDVNSQEGILLFVFSGDLVTGELAYSEEGTLEWVDIKLLTHYKVVEDIPELISMIINHRKTKKIFHGKYLYDAEGKRKASWEWE